MNTMLLIASLLIVLGIVGSILPAMPGPLFSFIGLLFAYFALKTGTISSGALVAFGIVTFLLMISDYVIPILGAKISGASKKGQWGAIIGAILGILFFPPLGIFIGAMLGAIVVELFEGKKFSQALKAGIGVMAGSIVSMVLQFIFTIIVAIYFIAKLF